MQLDKQFVVDELRKQGKSKEAQKVIDEMPEKIDQDEHAQQLQKLGVDPGDLAQKAAQRGIASL